MDNKNVDELLTQMRKYCFKHNLKLLSYRLEIGIALMKNCEKAIKTFVRLLV